MGAPPRHRVGNPTRGSALLEPNTFRLLLDHLFDVLQYKKKVVNVG